jgi:hypothetical protein
MTPVEIAGLILLTLGDESGTYKICINDECASYYGTAPPDAYYFSDINLGDGIRVTTPGQSWQAECGSHCCQSYSGSSAYVSNQRVVKKICVSEDYFSIYFLEE